jgi:hypothetical protein
MDWSGSWGVYPPLPCWSWPVTWGSTGVAAPRYPPVRERVQASHGINRGARLVAAALGLVADPREERQSMIKLGGPRSPVPPGPCLWRQRLLGR